MRSPQCRAELACSALHICWAVLGCSHAGKRYDCRRQYGMGPCSSCVHSLDPSGNSAKSSCHEQQDTHCHQLSREAGEAPSEHGGPHTRAPGSLSQKTSSEPAREFLKQKDKKHLKRQVSNLRQVPQLYVWRGGFEGVLSVVTFRL